MTELRCAVYARVSTARQAEHNISIPDQLVQARRYAEQRGWPVVAEYVEAGASARDDKRPQFQAMIDAACAKPSAFDVILVHSYSRFFRDEVHFELYRRRLEKHGVALASLTQEFGEGAGADLTRRIVALMDEMQSAENAKHVSRSMIRNAKEGFWNGRTSFGYVTVAAEQRGQKIKKRLAIDPQAAEIVKLIFKLFLEGDGKSGPLGVKHIAAWLNANGYKTETGKPFYTSRVHSILTHEGYTGRASFNRTNSRTGAKRPREEWVTIEIPAIIPEATFRRVQALLKARRPDRTPARITSSDVLLTGVAVCECCGKPLMIATSKRNRYRYYKCAGRLLTGAVCGGKPIREEQLDAAALEALTETLLTPKRAQVIVSKAAERRANGRKDALESLLRLRGQLGHVKKQLRNLMDALSDGLTGDTSTFRDKMAALEKEREDIEGLIAAQERSADQHLRPISLADAEIATRAFRKRLLDAPLDVRKRYIHGIISEITVSPTEIDMWGPESALAEVLSGLPLAHVRVSKGAVRSLGREWCAHVDSNHGPAD